MNQFNKRLQKLLLKWRVWHKVLLLILLVWSTLSAAAEQDMQQGLITALRATLNHHPLVKSKQSELDAQHYRVDSAKAGRYPTLSLQANNLDNEYDRGVLRLQQPVWTFGKISSAIDLAEAGFTAQQLELLQVQRQLMEETAVVYAKIEGINQRGLVADDNVEQHQTLFQRIERRQKGSLATEADVKLAHSRLLQAQVQRQSIGGELLVALSELQGLTQIYVTTDTPVDPLLAELPSAQQAQTRAINNSADLELKRQRWNVAKLEIQKEKVASTPNIYFQVDHDIGSSQLNQDRTRYGLNFVANFDGMGFTSRGQVKSAIARSEAAKFDLYATKSDVKRRVSILMLNRKVQEDSIVSQREVVESLSATMASFVRQYQSGHKTWVEVLNTQRELTQQRIQLTQIENDWLILSLRVATLIGKLDQLAGINTL
ncbi:TolC family protein [Aliiglaciecola sp. LCG003]|uniref:TolC family protein n=1 Tax=Aliiglaciecola sp. LCG003 TaxID=3053655 RepID=UPI0025723ACA|nr:TolC family protein [Aliiglaciecola sp. LCG003]WJG09308.1 TolC family protein [Aliiglaciecola sp. LCG003]